MTKKKPSPAVKAAADRAEARSEGKPIEEPIVPIDPEIRPVSEAELREAALAIAAKEEAKTRIAYTPELGAEICKRMVTRCPIRRRMLSLTEICAAEDMPHEETVRRWRKLHPDFGGLYAHAREERTHIMAEEVVEISDQEPDNVRARNRMDARKWFASRVNRRDYGDKVDSEISGPGGKPIEINSGDMTEAARRIAFMLRAGFEAQKRAERAKAIQIEAEAQDAEGA